MEPKKKYSWKKQKNGKYKIFDLEIFKDFDDEEKGKVGPREAFQILDTFKKQQKLGHYPRVHLGHHDSIENKPGVGFLDNIRYRSGIYFADIVEIGKEIFSRILDGQYPYRSIEYIPEKKEFSSLALLESQNPYHKLPMTFLENKVAFQASNFVLFSEEASDMKFCEGCDDKDCKDRGKKDFCDKKEKENFEDGEKKNYKLKFAEDDELEDEELEDEELEDEELEDENKEGEMDEELEDEGGEDDLEGLMGGEEEGENGDEKIEEVLDQLKQLTAMISKIYAMEQQEQEGMSQQQPNPISYSDTESLTHFFQSIENRLDRIENKSSADSEVKRLRALCEVNPIVNFQENKKTLLALKDTDSRKVFLKHVEASSQNFQSHPAESYRKSYMQDSRAEIFQKYTDKEDRNVAKMAYTDYVDTVEYNAKRDKKELERFQAVWPDAKTYVEHVVAQSQADPNLIYQMRNNR